MIRCNREKENMSSKEELEKLLEKCLDICKGNKIQKLLKVPKGIVVSKIMEEIAFCLKKPIRCKVKTFWGEEMLVIIPEVVSLNIYRYRFFEEDLTKMILEYLKPGMTFFDIGAHFGYYTLLASFIVGEKGIVHSF